MAGRAAVAAPPPPPEGARDVIGQDQCGRESRPRAGPLPGQARGGTAGAATSSSSRNVFTARGARLVRPGCCLVVCSVYPLFSALWDACWLCVCPAGVTISYELRA